MKHLETIGLKAAVSLRDAICRGEIPAGGTLRLDVLAKQFGVSRIPLRDALRQLQIEGYVSITPYRGARVRPVSVAESQEISTVSLLLHNDALRRAFPHFTGKQLDRSEALIRRRAKAADSNEWMILNEQFLQVFYGPAESPFLVSLIKQVAGQCLRYLHLFQYGVAAGHAPAVSLLDVVTACRRDDLPAASAALEEGHRCWLETLTFAIAATDAGRIRKS